MPSALDKTLAALPIARSLIGDSDTQRINNKFDIFSGPGLSNEKKINRLSVASEYDHQMEFTVNGGRIPNVYYHQLMYNSNSEDKNRRMKTYRTMAAYPEVRQALKEIANEFFVRDDQGQIIKGKLRDAYNEQVRTLIEKEFQSFLQMFRLKEKGNQMALDFVTEGELFWENIVSALKPEKGILGVTRIGSDRIDPLYYDIDNELIDSFILRTKIQDDYPFQAGKYAYSNNNRSHAQQILFLNEQQVTYIYNNEWEASGRKFRVPPIAVAHGPYTQLSLIEDATVIYMLVRAPERLVFNIATGNMPAQKTEQYIKRMMAQFWSKKTISKTGQIENVYDPQSMMENYWFPKASGQEGSTVTSVGGGAQTMGNLEVLNYFVQKLYKSLQVPLSRLNSDTAFSDGEAITREELKFAQEIIKMQTRWAEAFKRTFIIHLKLKGRKVMENARKLGVQKIDVPSKDKNRKNVFNSMGVNQIYADNFTHVGWDNYDILVQEVNKALAEKKKVVAKSIEVLREKQEEFRSDILALTNQIILETDETLQKLIVEKRTLLAEEIEAIKLVVEDYQNEIKELEEDNTSWWDQYELKEEDFEVTFNPPSNFFALREIQMVSQKVDMYNSLAADDMMSKTFLMKKFLGWSDSEILQNRSMAENDAGFRFVLAQCEANGIDWNSKLREQAQGMESDLGGGLGGSGGGSLPAPGGGGDSSLPDFGEPVESPEGGGNTETGGAPETPGQPEQKPEGQ
jgi:hypothetical protein